MSDFLSQFLGADGCAQDGSLASANPVGALMNTMFEGPNAMMGDALDQGMGGGGMMLQPSGSAGGWAGEYGDAPGGPMMTNQAGMMGTAFAEAQAAQMMQHQAAVAAQNGMAHTEMQQAWSQGAQQSQPMQHFPPGAVMGGGGMGGSGMMMMGGGGSGCGGGMEMSSMMQMQQMQRMSMMQQQSQQQPRGQQYQQPFYQQQQQQQQQLQPQPQQQYQQQYQQQPRMGEAAYDVGGLQHAVGQVAAPLSSQQSSGEQPLDAVLEHAQQSSATAHGQEAASAGAAELEAGAVDGEEAGEMPEEVREKMEAAFADAMANTRQNEEAEFAEYEALMRQHQQSTSSAASQEVYHEGGTNPAWACTAAALEAMGDNQAYTFLGDNPLLAPLLERVAEGVVGGTQRAATSEALVSSCFEKGLALFEKGQTVEAVQQFEAAIQVVGREVAEQQSLTADPLAAGPAPIPPPSVAECWRVLGACHQELDEDRKAITCLERAIDDDPYNLDALLSLGVSYVNELDSPKALRNLKAWVQHHPAYHGLEVEADNGYGDPNEDPLMDEVMQLMLQASAFVEESAGDADQSDARADVQVVLGVLYNVSRDFEAASDAFELASHLRPADHSAWNKLGATRANNSASEQALPAYHRALQLKPRYARGWLNLGIAHANLGNHHASARAYLHALTLNPGAGHIWNYLRMTLGNLDRYDLVQLAGQQDAEAFKAHFPPIHNNDPTALLDPSSEMPGSGVASGGASGGGAAAASGGGGGGGGKSTHLP